MYWFDVSTYGLLPCIITNRVVLRAHSFVINLNASGHVYIHVTTQVDSGSAGRHNRAQNMLEREKVLKVKDKQGRPRKREKEQEQSFPFV
jgi:hypothetical protein